MILSLILGLTLSKDGSLRVRRTISLYERLHNDPIQACGSNRCLHATTITGTKRAPPIFSGHRTGGTNTATDTGSGQMRWKSRWILHGERPSPGPRDFFHEFGVIGDHGRSERLRRLDAKVASLPFGITLATAAASKTAAKEGKEGRLFLFVSSGGGIVSGCGCPRSRSSSTIAEPKADGKSYDTEEDTTNDDPDEYSVVGARIKGD